MKYKNITKAIFIKRPNRFIAEVEVDGKKETVHVKNTGRCRELLIPGCEVWLTAPGTPDRKTKYDLVAVRKNTGVIFNMDSQAPNAVVKEWLAKQDFSKVLPEYRYGESRIDFYMEKEAEHINEPENNGQDFGQNDDKICRYLMEVKGCTQEIDGVGYFPDAPTERGVKHIRELIKAKNEGYKAILTFVIQMDGVEEVRANVATHPEFGEAMEDARKAGVEILFLQCHVTEDEIYIK